MKKYIVAVTVGMLLTVGGAQAFDFNDYFNRKDPGSYSSKSSFSSTVSIGGKGAKATVGSSFKKGDKVKFQMTAVSGKGGGSVSLVLKEGSKTTRKSLPRSKGKSITYKVTKTGKFTMTLSHGNSADFATRKSTIKITK